MSSPAEASVFHPTAIVMPGVEVGVGVEIGPYSVVEPGVEIGDHCRIGPQVHLLGRIELGPRCVLRAGTVLGGEPQDDKYDGARSLVRIGPDCQFHEHTTVHRATGEGEETCLGARIRMMAGSHVGHNCLVGDDVVMVNGSGLGGHVQVGQGCILSGQSAVHQFTRIGRLAMVAGGTMVTRDVPPFSIVTGAHPMRWRGINRVGLQRAGFPPAERDAIRAALRALFGPQALVREIADKLLLSDHAAVRELAEFVLSSSRGICAGPLKR